MPQGIGLVKRRASLLKGIVNILLRLSP